MHGVGRVLVLFSLAAVGGCELVLDLENEADEPPMLDGGAPIVDAAPPAARCTTNPLYVRINGSESTYRILSPDPFDTARRRCQGDGADLAVLGTMAEQAELEFDLTELPMLDGCFGEGCVWIGLRQRGLDGVGPEVGWEWIDGQVASIVWRMSQPDDGDEVEDGEENCAVIDAAGLADRPCDAEHQAICECVLGPDL